MASPIAITITNLPEIKAAFGRAPALMSRELNTAIKKTIFKIQSRSMVNTPVLTGRLRASHQSIFSNLRGEVGTHTNYDVYVHNGTRFMRGRPFLYNAVEESQTDVDNYFVEAVDNVLGAIGRDI